MRLTTIRIALGGRLHVRAPDNYADPVPASDRPDLTSCYIPSDYKQVVAFAILIVALLVRPQGLIPAKGLAVA